MRVEQSKSRAKGAGLPMTLTLQSNYQAHYQHALTLSATETADTADTAGASIINGAMSLAQQGKHQ